MSARRLPLPSIVEGEVRLPRAPSHYLARVLRLRAGDRFEAFDPRAGLAADAEVIAIEDDAVIARMGAIRREGDAEQPVVLVQGYPKGDRLGNVVRDATELGATMVIPAVSVRSVVRPDAAKVAARAERWSAIAAEAARQCGRVRAPTILAPMPWDDAIAAARAIVTDGFVLSEGARTPLADDLLALASRAHAGVVFAIGPEGGLAEEELACAERAGFPARSIGPTTLRTETAATAVLAAWRVLAARDPRRQP